MKVYIAVNTELHEGEDLEFFNLGVFTSKKQAIECLERQAEDDLNMFDAEDAANFERTTFEDGHFTLTDEYNTYEYRVEEKDLNTEE